MKSSESKERQHNGQKKKDKRTNYDLQNITQKLKIEQYDLHQKRWVNSGAQVLETRHCGTKLNIYVFIRRYRKEQ
jgi:hypothetical protein